MLPLTLPSLFYGSFCLISFHIYQNVYIPVTNLSFKSTITLSYITANSLFTSNLLMSVRLLLCKVAFFIVVFFVGSTNHFILHFKFLIAIHYLENKLQYSYFDFQGHPKSSPKLISNKHVIFQ